MPSGVYVRTKSRSPEIRQQISEALKGRPSPMKGRTHSTETKQKMSDASLGRPKGPMTDETKEKISESKTGVVMSPETRAKIAASTKKGVEHHEWKGDKVSYGTLHAWVRRHLGTPSKCAECGFTSDNRRQFQWANISHEYRRELNDFIRLCVKCHKAYDQNKLILTQERG